MTTIEDFRRMAALAGERVLVAALPGRDMQVLGELARILTRCDDLDAMVAADGRLDPTAVRIDAARIRDAAEAARALLVGRGA